MQTGNAGIVLPLLRSLFVKQGQDVEDEEEDDDEDDDSLFFDLIFVFFL